ncbi:MAG: chromate efflux transporter [Verrucomicrobiota bacterium]
MSRNSISLFDLFLIYLRLGLTSFGGPVAHLGYFREEFVRRRKWLEDNAYADLVALCQFLPGPASSQVSYAIGYQQRGWWGGFLAWCGFTLPSAFALILFAYGLNSWGRAGDQGWIMGLKIAAVAVVAKAVWGMGTTLCRTKVTVTFALVSASVALLFPTVLTQIGTIGLGALGGWILIPSTQEKSGSGETRFSLSKRKGVLCLLTFFILLVGLSIGAAVSQFRALEYFDGFYRSGAFVFGGGHVVLPLLEEAVVQPGWVSQTDFLAGYGAAQAVPGPLFTFAAFLGASAAEAPNGWFGGLFCLVAIYIPSILLVTGILPFWESLRQNRGAKRALAGTNAAVVGLLLAAFYDPIWTASIISPSAAAFALVAFLLLQFWKMPPWALVILSGFAGWGLL